MHQLSIPTFEVVNFGTINTELMAQAEIVFCESFPKLKPENLHKAINTRGSIGFVALNEFDNRVIGMAVASIDTPAYRGTSEACLEYLAVLDDYRGQGIGETILNQVENSARQAGKRQITLESSFSAFGFYRHPRIGYKQMALPSRVMRKKLV